MEQMQMNENASTQGPQILGLNSFFLNTAGTGSDLRFSSWHSFNTNFHCSTEFTFAHGNELLVTLFEPFVAINKQAQTTQTLYTVGFWLN